MMGSLGSRASLAWVGSINKQAFREKYSDKNMTETNSQLKLFYHLVSSLLFEN